MHESERLPKDYRASVTGYTLRKDHDNTKPFVVTYHEILEQVNVMRNPPAKKPPRKKKPKKIPKKLLKEQTLKEQTAEDPLAALIILAGVAAKAKKSKKQLRSERV